jgi:hypothetical protein
MHGLMKGAGISDFLKLTAPDHVHNPALNRSAELWLGILEVSQHVELVNEWDSVEL